METTEFLLELLEKGDVEKLINYILKNPDQAPTMLIELLFTAAALGNDQVVTSIITTGINVNLRNSTGRTALEACVENLHLSTARTLLEHGSDVNLQDEYGNTPLHISIDSELEQAKYLSDVHHKFVPASADMTQLLLDYGANPDILAHDGENARDLTRLIGHTEAINILSKIKKLEG